MEFSAKGTQSGSDTEAWLKKMSQGPSIFARLSHFGAEGVAALAAATPTGEGTGETAGAWGYQILQDAGTWSIVWTNSHVVDGRQIAVLLHYGHGTRTGGYVAPKEYINSALAPIFDRMAEEGWKVVTES